MRPHDPEQRTLDNVLGLRPIAAVPPGRIERTVKWARRKPVHAVLAGVLVVTLPVVALLAQRAFEARRLAQGIRLDGLLQEMRALDQRADDRALVEVCSRILDLDPHAVGALRMRSVAAALLAQELRDTDAAAAARYGERAAEDATRLIELQPQDAWPHQLMSFVLERLGQAAAAEQARARAGELERTGAGDPYFEALNARDAGDLERADALLSDLLARKPGERGALMTRASLRERLGRPEDALEDYRVAAALDPTTRSRGTTSACS